MSKDEALKLARELDNVIEDVEQGNGFDNVCLGTIKYVRDALADSALDRMAENARELGLDYEPPCKTGSQCTSKCQQCEQPAQYFDEVLYDGTSTREALVRFQTNVQPRGEATSAPVAEVRSTKEPHKQQEPIDTDWDAVHEKLIEVWNREISADEGLDEIQDLIYTSPPASKPWVGLTDEEIDELDRKNYGFPQPVAWRGPFARAVEAKLKERNA